MIKILIRSNLLLPQLGDLMPAKQAPAGLSVMLEEFAVNRPSERMW